MRASSSRHVNDTHQNSLYPGLNAAAAVSNDTLRDGDPIGTNTGNRNSQSTARPSASSFKVTDQASSLSRCLLQSEYSPSTSPQSFLEPNNANSTTSSSSKYDWRLHSLVLCRHILMRGLIDGVGSDVKVHVPAWDKVYHLHRLILDQNPYFSLLLQGGFQEASSDSVTLHFEDNPFITADSFYFVLSQLYGKLAEPSITRDNVREILATCSFFHLEHMCQLCIEFILRTLNVDNVAEYLVFADENRVHGSDRIVDACFTFLCREAYTMHPETVAALPLPWIKMVLDSDAFWVPSEYARYLFALRILNTRISCFTTPSSSSSSSTTTTTNGLEEDSITPPPAVVSEETEPFTEEAEMQKRSSFAPSPISPPAADGDDEEKEPSASIDIEELETFQDIFLQSIHYMHMTFEQLESIRSDTHPLTGEPVVPEAILKDALWQQIQMRSRIEAASENDTALGFTVNEDSPHCNPLRLIPTDDMTTYTGESALSGSAAAAAAATAAASASAALEPTRRRRSPKRTGGASNNNKNNSADGSSSSPAAAAATNNNKQYSIYPPFRFSVEFADFAALKHNVRVYSKSVFYAGSNWNVYVQKTRSQRKGVLQLGVYLHRQSVPFGPCNHDEDASQQQQEQQQQQQCTRRCTPDLSQFSRYADKRKIVKAWFRIFCPARGPKHTMTLFQSSPDNFSVLQSWGWRSATLCADECLDTANNCSNDDPGAAAAALDENTERQHAVTPPPPLHAPTTSSNHNDDQVPGCGSYPGTSLRFTVVMGHI